MIRIIELLIGIFLSLLIYFLLIIFDKKDKKRFKNNEINGNNNVILNGDYNKSGK